MTSDQDEILIRAEQLSLAFKDSQAVLQDVSFVVRTGEFVTLLGPSGCGKSTLLRLIAGLLEPTAGSLHLGSQPPQHARKDKHRVGLVFQDPVLLPWRNVEKNLRLPLELSPVSDPPTVSSLLDLVGLSAADASKRPSQLSGGMRMRVSLARALVTRPDVFLLDEPFAALVDILRQQLNEELLRICAQQGCTTVFVTHNVAEAVFLSQRVLILGGAPASVVAEVVVPFGPSRPAALRGSAEFAAMVQSISDRLREAVACAG